MAEKFKSIPSEVGDAVVKHGLMTIADADAVKKEFGGAIPVFGKGGLIVGGLYQMADGRYLAVPGNLPTKTGTADEGAEFLAQFTTCHVFPVILKFSTPQLTHTEFNEDSILDAIKTATFRGSQGKEELKLEGIIVGSAHWEPTTEEEKERAKAKLKK